MLSFTQIINAIVIQLYVFKASNFFFFFGYNNANRNRKTEKKNRNRKHKQLGPSEDSA
jgi:hypothetical protein